MNWNELFWEHTVLLYSTAYNLWTFTWFVHFELPFRLKGTEKIHTERFFKFLYNIYSIMSTTHCCVKEYRTLDLNILWGNFLNSGSLHSSYHCSGYNKDTALCMDSEYQSFSIRFCLLCVWCLRRFFPFLMQFIITIFFSCDKYEDWR